MKKKYFFFIFYYRLLFTVKKKYRNCFYETQKKLLWLDFWLVFELILMWFSWLGTFSLGTSFLFSPLGWSFISSSAISCTITHYTMLDALPVVRQLLCILTSSHYFPILARLFKHLLPLTDYPSYSWPVLKGLTSKLTIFLNLS